MKKSLFLAMSLCSVIAFAQDYSGRVGINTEEPTATLNVKSKIGTTKETKNFELSNADGKILLSTFDDGNIGIGTNGVYPFYKLQVMGGDIMTEGRLISQKETNEGGRLVLSNPKKDADDNFRNWVLYNMTGEYGNSLQFFGYTKADGAGDKSMMSLFDNGNLGIGQFANHNQPSQKLDVQGNARLRTLPNVLGGSMDKIVVVDDTGVLKSVERSSVVSGVKATTTTEICSDVNLGAIHFKEVEISSTTPVQKKGVFGFCTKQDNTAMWVYLSNGGNIIQGTGAFGQGL